MRYPKLRALAALLLGAMTALGGGAATAAELAVGDTAPDFTLTGSDGKQHRLAD
jgi:hypothetical protein